MSEPVMSLSEGDLQYIGQYVRTELPGWLRGVGPWAFASQLMERMVRVEEELKAQRELLLAHVEASERRFEDIDRRFEDINRRFDDVNKRFDDVNKRFDDVNKRFDDVNKRSEDLNRRFDDNSKRHTATRWFVGAGFLVVTTLLSLYQFLG